VALEARRGSVGAGQRERSLRGVIEARWSPGRGGVAELAVLRESGGHVVRTLGGLVIRKVARVASRVESGVLPIGMAL
jgi:hypothetical protein